MENGFIVALPRSRFVLLVGSRSIAVIHVQRRIDGVGKRGHAYPGGDLSRGSVIKFDLVIELCDSVHRSEQNVRSVALSHSATGGSLQVGVGDGEQHREI